MNVTPDKNFSDRVRPQLESRRSESLSRQEARFGLQQFADDSSSNIVGGFPFLG
jgi:hypothetical protein